MVSIICWSLELHYVMLSCVFILLFSFIFPLLAPNFSVLNDETKLFNSTANTQSETLIYQDIVNLFMLLLSRLVSNDISKWESLSAVSSHITLTD